MFTAFIAAEGERRGILLHLWAYLLKWLTANICKQTKCPSCGVLRLCEDVSHSTLKQSLLAFVGAFESIPVMDTETQTPGSILTTFTHQQAASTILISAQMEGGKHLSDLSKLQKVEPVVRSLFLPLLNYADVSECVLFADRILTIDRRTVQTLFSVADDEDLGDDCVCLSAQKSSKKWSSQKKPSVLTSSPFTKFYKGLLGEQEPETWRVGVPIGSYVM